MAERFASRFRGSKLDRNVGLRVEGLLALLHRLDEFPARIQRRVLRPALTKATTPVVKAARRLAPKGSGLTPSGHEREHLGKTITKTRPKWYSQSGTLVIVIGPEKGKSPHSHLVHDGTAPHPIVLGKAAQLGTVVLPAGFVIQHPGAKPNPFLSNAVDATQERSSTILRTEIAKGIDKQARLLAAKK